MPEPPTRPAVPPLARHGARRPGGRSARVRQAVFDAALDLLARDGYRALSFDAVAAAAGVNKTTLYRNWRTKTALILAAAEARSATLISVESSGHPESDLTAFLGSVAENVMSPLGRALVMALLGESDDAEAAAARTEFWERRFEAARPLIRAATGGRRQTSAEVDEFIELLLGPLYLRVFGTGAPVDKAFVRNTVRRALRTVR